MEPDGYQKLTEQEREDIKGFISRLKSIKKMIEEQMGEIEVECEDCGVVLGLIDEKEKIVMCPKCGCTYDLKIWKG